MKQILRDSSYALKPVIISNIANTGKLALSNIADDPAYFALQIARRFRSKPLVRRGIGRFASDRVNLNLRAVAATLKDDSRLLRIVCRQFLAAPNSSKDAVFLANLCIALSEWDLAERLLETGSGTKSYKKTKARLLWSLGRMTEAISVLESTYRGRQLRHYLSEWSIFNGLEPKLPSSNESKCASANACTVHYVVTNSLPHTGSGYAQRTHSILKSLVEEGWDVKALTRVNYPINIGKLTAKSEDIVSGIVYERCLPFPARYDLAGRIQQQAEELLGRVRRDNPSILHTTTDFSNALAVKAVSAATGVPWVYEVRGQLADTWLSTRPVSTENSERYQLFIEREAYVARHADHVFTLGETMKQNLIGMGVEESKISILPNGIGDDFLDEPVERNEARRQLGLDTDAYYIGTVSSIVPYEGLSTVVRAVAELAHEFENLRLLIVGDGTERENLIKLARELSIEARCEFPGRVPRERAHLYYASLNTFVVPRIDAAVTRSVTPLKPVEALASNVPVLASDLPALREIIREGENGHLIEPGNVAAWAKRVRCLILDPQRATNMGKSGRDFVLANRTWRQNARSIAQVYERVISKASEL